MGGDPSAIIVTPLHLRASPREQNRIRLVLEGEDPGCAGRPHHARDDDKVWKEPIIEGSPSELHAPVQPGDDPGQPKAPNQARRIVATRRRLRAGTMGDTIVSQVATKTLRRFEVNASQKANTRRRMIQMTFVATSTEGDVCTVDSKTGSTIEAIARRAMDHSVHLSNSSSNFCCSLRGVVRVYCIAMITEKKKVELGSTRNLDSPALDSPAGH